MRQNEQLILDLFANRKKRKMCVDIAVSVCGSFFLFQIMASTASTSDHIPANSPAISQLKQTDTNNTITETKIPHAQESKYKGVQKETLNEYSEQAKVNVNLNQ